MAGISPETVFDIWMVGFIGLVLVIFLAAWSIRDRWERDE